MKLEVLVICGREIFNWGLKQECPGTAGRTLSGQQALFANSISVVLTLNLLLFRSSIFRPSNRAPIVRKFFCLSSVSKYRKTLLLFQIFYS